MQEWLNKIEEQLSDNKRAVLVNHAGGNHSESGNERADEVNKMSHGRGGNVIKCALACERQEIATEHMILRYWRSVPKMKTKTRLINKYQLHYMITDILYYIILYYIILYYIIL